MSILNVQISCFANYHTADNPRPLSLLRWLHSAKYADQVARVRQAVDPAERKRLKAALPAITPSGLFARRAEKALIRHSGLLQFDIDAKDNHHLTNFEHLKAELAKVENIAYIARSVSGNGWWGLIPIAYPDRHQDHFRAIEADFLRWGIFIDGSCKDVSRLRGYTYDPEAYFNHHAKPYRKLAGQGQPPARRRRYERPQGSEADKVEACLQKLAAGKIDITQGYDNWFGIGCALANAFGEAGRSFFHQASQYHTGYSEAATDQQFDACLKGGYARFTLGTFFGRCADYGVTFADVLPAEPPPVLGTVALPHPALQLPAPPAAAEAPELDPLDGWDTINPREWELLPQAELSRYMKEFLDLEAFFAARVLPPSLHIGGREYIADLPAAVADHLRGCEVHWGYGELVYHLERLKGVRRALQRV